MCKSMYLCMHKIGQDFKGSIAAFHKQTENVTLKKTHILTLKLTKGLSPKLI